MDLLNYIPIEVSFAQLLDNSQKNNITFFWQNKLDEDHYQTMKDFFKKVSD